MAIQIKLRRDQSSIWDSDNPVLLAGEMAFQFDSGTSQVGRFKIGNGSREWSRLPYFYAYQDSSGAYPSSGGSSGPWYGSRGLHVGGMSSNAIDYFDITSSGNASDFGDLSTSRRGMGAVSDKTYGVFAGGYTSSNVNTIDYITIASTGNAADFGDMAAVTRDHMSVHNANRACFGGGSTSGDANKIEYITLGGATSGNASDFGDLTVARNGNEGGMNDATRGVFGSGYTVNVLDYITIGTLGNATDFGDHTGLSYGASTSDLTKGVTAGGSDSTVRNYISYITIQTAGNATDFGDLTVARNQLAATTDATYGVFSGGFDYSNAVNTIDRISIATTGNATDHGDLNKSGNAMRFGGSTSGAAS